jgi:GTP-binding protein HflX
MQSQNDADQPRDDSDGAGERNDTDPVQTDPSRARTDLTHTRTAVVAKRAADGEPNTGEIRKLAAAAGYDIVAECTQTRPPDPALQFGRGKAEVLAETVAETGASAVVFDNELTPTQTVEIARLCPDETEVLDRHRLVLDIFERRAGSKRAGLQVERAALTYDLPRIREAITRELAGEDLAHDEQGGQRVRDVERRIDELDRKLAELGDDAEARRERRREEGFEFVALAGYTNAGKSTLLHRLADDLDFGAASTGDSAGNGDETGDTDGDPCTHETHADLDATAAVEDRLFETLDTTTRRATIDGRRTLVTDTVGFVDDLPHDLVESFHGTLSATESADCVVLVADASDSPADLRRKLETAIDILDDATGAVVVALNKADLLDGDELAERETVVETVGTEAVEVDIADSLAVSAVEGENLGALRDRIADALPELRETELVLPNEDAAMSLVSWLYDRADVSDVRYRGDEVEVDFEAKESVAERAKSRAESM